MTNSNICAPRTNYFCVVEYIIAINNEGTTDLSALKNMRGVIKRLSMQGVGRLGACMLTFSKIGDEARRHKDLLFIKPLHERSETLLPHLKEFSVDDYDFCSLQVFTGELKQGDTVKLMVTVEE